MKPFVLAGVLSAAVLGVGVAIATGFGGRVVAPTSEAAPAVEVAATDRATATLAVDNMYCASCPYIVRTALTRTPGVIAAEVSLRDRTAVVTYDRKATTVATLVAATTAAGYPSRALP